MNNVEVKNNAHDELRKVGCEKCGWVASIVPEKRVYNDTFVIVSYEQAS